MTEAKYIAASAAIKKAIWLRSFLSELSRLRLPYMAPLLIENQSAITLIKNPKHHEWTKYIAVCYYFIHNAYEDSVIEPEYVLTGDQVADILN